MTENDYLGGLSLSTFKVYFHILRTNQDTISIRKLQRELNFSSPSSVVFHVQKLVEHGFLREENNKYTLQRREKIGPLTHFFFLKGKIIPKDLIYFLVVLAMTSAELYFNPVPSEYALVYIPLFIALALFLFNTISEFKILNRFLR